MDLLQVYNYLYLLLLRDSRLVVNGALYCTLLIIIILYFDMFVSYNDNAKYLDWVGYRFVSFSSSLQQNTCISTRAVKCRSVGSDHTQQKGLKIFFRNRRRSRQTERERERERERKRERERDVLIVFMHKRRVMWEF